MYFTGYINSLLSVSCPFPILALLVFPKVSIGFEWSLMGSVRDSVSIVKFWVIFFYVATRDFRKMSRKSSDFECVWISESQWHFHSRSAELLIKDQFPDVSYWMYHPWSCYLFIRLYTFRTDVIIKLIHSTYLQVKVDVCFFLLMNYGSFKYSLSYIEIIWRVVYLTKKV